MMALVQYDETQAQGNESFLPAHWATDSQTRFVYLHDTRQVGNFIPPSAGKGATYLLFALAGVIVVAAGGRPT